MFDPTTETMKVLTTFAQDLKRLHPAIIPRSNPIEILGNDRETLLDILKWTHPSGDRVKPGSRIFVGAKPLECDRAGLSQTCYFIQLEPGDRLWPLWFAECRKGIRSKRLNQGSLPADRAN